MERTWKAKLMRAQAALKRLARALPLLCVLSQAAGAEVPVKFTYQGNLRQNGFLVNGQRSMVFRIYPSSVAAGELWTSPAYDVSLSTGVFRVTLEPAITDWQNGNMWLELEIEGNRMSPREELTSSPYAINSLMVSGKRYTSAASAPAPVAVGDLWYDTALNALNYWNGSAWVPTSGSGLPGAHADTHAGGGSDPIVSIGTHTVTGDLTLEGILNPATDLRVGGGGYSVNFASSVTAGWYYGDGSGLDNLNASEIESGTLSGDRIGEVIVSTHIVDGSVRNEDLADGAVTRSKLGQSGCSTGEILQWDGSQWICASGGAAGLETDPLSIHNQNTLQAGTTFYVSSGTVNDLNVNNSLKVMGTAMLKGGPGEQGLTVDSGGNVGVGTQTPRARMEVSGKEAPGEYIMIFTSGPKMAAWLRNKQ